MKTCDRLTCVIWIDAHKFYYGLLKALKTAAQYLNNTENNSLYKLQQNI